MPGSKIRTLTDLLVSEDEEDRIPQLVLCQHPHQLLASLANTLTIVAVHHEDET